MILINTPILKNNNGEDDDQVKIGPLGAIYSIKMSMLQSQIEISFKDARIARLFPMGTAYVKPWLVRSFALKAPNRDI